MLSGLDPPPPPCTHRLRVRSWAVSTRSTRAGRCVHDDLHGDRARVDRVAYMVAPFPRRRPARRKRRPRAREQPCRPVKEGRRRRPGRRRLLCASRRPCSKPAARGAGEKTPEKRQENSEEKTSELVGRKLPSPIRRNPASAGPAGPEVGCEGRGRADSG